MDDGTKSLHFMIGQLHVTLCNRWYGFGYINRIGAEGWFLTLGHVTFWGHKAAVKI